MSLARDVINPDKNNRHFDVGTLLALFATGTQLRTVIVAGRGAALCFRQAVYYSEKPSSSSKDESSLQLFGILFFVFFMFEYVRYPIIFYIACGLGLVWWKPMTDRDRLTPRLIKKRLVQTLTLYYAQGE
ncbi:hypothetical protein BD779DRAFT_1473494 [Infundibulicybe gibba]|nr:hypothetical protein BD779DRAFT_1473494 [Infundibulicybe gibba]